MTDKEKRANLNKAIVLIDALRNDLESIGGIDEHDKVATYAHVDNGDGTNQACCLCYAESPEQLRALLAAMIDDLDRSAGTGPHIDSPAPSQN